MAGNDPVDQDAIAAQWEASLDSEDPAEAAEAAAANELSGTMALQWAAMVEDGSRDFGGGKNGGERVLSQEEIDNLLGFSVGDVNVDDNSGVRAIINSALVSYERLPMLEIVFDRLVRLMTTSLRNFTSDNVEVSLDSITSIRFGDYLNSIPLPAILAVFHAAELDNYGLFTVDSNLIYSIVDVLLGGRRGSSAMRIEGRPYTTIERTLVQRMVEVILTDMCAAFEPLAPVNFTLEPIRKLLLQQFMGEKFGRDSIWESHLATELWSTKVDIDAILDEQVMPLHRIMNLEVGQTVMLNASPDS